MGPTLRDELIATPPPKLCLSSLPCHHHKPPPPSEPPGTLTPPLQPMVAVPFQWEEAPGRPRPRPIDPSSPCRPKPKPKSVRCLGLPPAAVLDNGPLVGLGPLTGRSVSHRLTVTPGLGLVGNGSSDGLNFGSGRWAGGNGTMWNNQELSKGNTDFSGWDSSGDVDIKVKVTRFRRRSKGSLHKLSYRSSRLLESMFESFKQIMAWRHRRSS